MDVFELSEINFGLILEGRRSAMEYSPEDFSDEPAWGKGIKILQKKGGTKEDLIRVLSPSLLSDARDAAVSVNGLGAPDGFDWRTSLITAKHNYDLGREGKRRFEKLEKNEDVDLLPLYGKMTSTLAGSTTGLTRADMIDSESYEPFISSGFPTLDEILGGIPADGPIIVYGMEGVGKSFFGSLLANAFLHKHKDKSAGIYTLEMSSEHYKWRALKMYPTMKDILDRLYISGSVSSIEELVAEVTTKRLDFVVLDDMDGIVRDETAGEYQKVYKRVREIARFLKIPVLVLAQPNRAAKLGNTFLSKYAISWSSGGENAAALQIALQKANELDLDDDIFPLEDEDRYFMIFWKSRDGWPAQQGPGAIRIEPDADGKYRQLWTGKPYKNRLWSPSSKKKKIGKKKVEKND